MPDENLVVASLCWKAGIGDEVPSILVTNAPTAAALVEFARETSQLGGKTFVIRQSLSIIN